MISNSAATHAKVAIYIRVSTLHQIDRDSLPMQRQDLIAYAKLILNTDDVTIFEDAGYSGKNTIRPEFQKMMSQLRTGTYTHLLVWKIDRISRNLLDFAEMYQELKNLGVTFVSKNEQFDTSTAMGEAMLKIILVFAELERNMTSERVTATMISRASNGQWNGGRIPYGYDYDPEEQAFSFNSDEYNIAHLIHDKYEELRSLVYLARYLNEHGYRTRAGNDWSPVSLDIILRSVFYCGDYQYNRLKEGDRQRPKDKSEWITVKDHHPAIVSREQKERILALLESNRRLKSFRKSGKRKLRSAYDQFHFHRKENYRQTLFSLLLPYAQEKQAVVYRKIYLRPNRWRVRLQLHSQYAQRSKSVLSGNEHTGTGTAATLRRYLLPGGRHCPGRIAGSVSYAPHRHRQGRGLRKRRQNQNRL